MEEKPDPLTTVYKCEKCEKVFSTENYLNSHIKRRHTDNRTANDGNDIVLAEIKELKEHLNSTDQLLQQISWSKTLIDQKNTNQDMLPDLEKKYCSFRDQVENEITTLRLEKKLYEDIYTKLFNVILQSKEKCNVLQTTGRYYD